MLRIAILGGGRDCRQSHTGLSATETPLRNRRTCGPFPCRSAKRSWSSTDSSLAFSRTMTRCWPACRSTPASICLPPFEHAPASITMLLAGKHVLVEKPMATCLQECDDMLSAAQATGKLLSVVAQDRFKTPMREASSSCSSRDCWAECCTRRSILTGGTAATTTTCGGAALGPRKAADAR